MVANANTPNDRRLISTRPLCETFVNKPSDLTLEDRRKFVYLDHELQKIQGMLHNEAAINMWFQFIDNFRSSVETLSKSVTDFGKLSDEIRTIVKDFTTEIESMNNAYVGNISSKRLLQFRACVAQKTKQFKKKPMPRKRLRGLEAVLHSNLKQFFEGLKQDASGSVN